MRAERAKTLVQFGELSAARVASDNQEGSSWGSIRDDCRSPFPSFDNEGDSALLGEVGSIMSQGKIHDAVMEGIRLGRLIALQKPDGGVRGIVVGDIMRRLVARTMAKQIAKKVEKATAPFQYAQTTKAGCECVAHILQTITDKDERATVVSIDGVGAYLISRNSMMEGMEDGDQVLPFVRCLPISA